MKHNVLETIYASLYGAFGPQHWWPGETPLEIAVGAILTQNTNWKNVEKAIQNLKTNKVLSARALHTIDPAALASLIRPAGYYHVKTGRLKNFIGFLVAEYRGSVKLMARETLPVIRNKLLSVNGIGQETADSMLLYALGLPVFVIDAYTKRILSRHGILGHDLPYATYQHLFHSGIRNNVRLFNEYHALLVRLAKDFCRTTPCCNRCPLEGLGNG
ncbi:MAG: endonuclease III domain-containing protein [Nitrospirae bacterium]|nr:endonuclease III domain-containing protein [Nitrospirota bacterium]